MKLDELRNLSKEDLVLKVAGFKEELSKLNYMKKAGQVDKPHRFKELRRNIARIQTLLNEKNSSKAKKG
jgi:large subunit ribosomal protein L29